MKMQRYSLVVLALAFCACVQADSISGFGGGSNWTLNNGSGGTAQFTDPQTLQITNDYAEANSAFYNTAVSYQTFTASFNYLLDPDSIAGGPGDGITFVVQNDSRGASAVGFGGSDLGYSNVQGGTGIAPSFAFALNQFTGHTVGINVISGGTSNYDYFDVSPVNVQDPLKVDLSYDGSNLSVSLTDTADNSVFSQSFVASTSLVGSEKAFVGFTGGTGGATANQSITNFSYNATPEPASMLILALPMLALKFRRKSR